MHIKTKYLGEMEVDFNKIIEFPSGLPGFTDERQFILLDMPGNPVFQILQSADTPEIAFIVVTPYHFYQDYVVDLDDSLLTSLAISNEADVMVLAIVTVKKPFDSSTLNLKAPIIINSQNQQGKQYILNTDVYPSKAAIALSASTSVKGE
ncbi:flagellar assembly protein FliW [Lentibacillus sp. CBA3610]|uniref:flagellar assembly protein FliW n=1 Tax=Lentibacillus sp. CBA3610 TaxID=2518176 RepID=UPI00159633E0|nr:flagellar assembly protein FliW [Lentibacillus sp. CBA3610]QKY69939.1 flagellar assembly protein FliW [Lentibacillus sp. CBA3610]